MNRANMNKQMKPGMGSRQRSKPMMTPAPMPSGDGMPDMRSRVMRPGGMKKGGMVKAKGK